MKTRRYRKFDMRSFGINRKWNIEPNKEASEFPTLKQRQEQVAYILLALCYLLLFYYVIKI